MPIRLTVSSSQHSYDVYVGGGLLREAGVRCRGIAGGAGRCAVITDERVGHLYAERVRTSLEEAGIQVHVITVPAGEASKSFGELESVCRRMIRAGLDRRSFAVALGGGVVGDLAGFAASIFFRGIPYVQAPTTIVSQVDSSVGGKTGINTDEGKNLIGSFHPPRLVLADTETLQSLPDREFREGFAEIIKHAAIRDAAMLDELESLDTGSRTGLEALIARNVGIKAAIVAGDEHETTGVRALLNFGHTIGHAIEASAGYGRFLHGEALGPGIRAALHLSERFSSLQPADSARILRLLRRFHLPLQLPADISTSDVLKRLGRDKKFDQGKIRFVLLRRPGEAFVSSDVTREAIAGVVEELRSAPEAG